MGVLADQPALEMGRPVELVEAQQRADPVLAVAEIIAAAALDDAVGIGLAPQPLIDAERRRHLAAQVEHVLQRIDPDRRLDEVDDVPGVPTLEQAHGLWLAPGLVDVDADQAFGPDAGAQGLEHRLLALLVDPGLDVVGAIAALDAVPGLALDLLRRAPFHVVEIVDLLAQRAAEQAIERLAAGLAAGGP